MTKIQVNFPDMVHEIKFLYFILLFKFFWYNNASIHTWLANQYYWYSCLAYFCLHQSFKVVLNVSPLRVHLKSDSTLATTSLWCKIVLWFHKNDFHWNIFAFQNLNCVKFLDECCLLMRNKTHTGISRTRGRVRKGT